MLWVRTPLRRVVFDTTLCDKVCQLIAKGRWFSPGTPVSSTNKTDRHDITEILLKVALNNTTPRSARVAVTTTKKQCTLVYPTCILVDWLIFGVNAISSNISAISMRPVLLEEEAFFVIYKAGPHSGLTWNTLRRGVLDTILFDKVYLWLATCQWFSPLILRFPPPIKLNATI